MTTTWLRDNAQWIAALGGLFFGLVGTALSIWTRVEQVRENRRRRETEAPRGRLMIERTVRFRWENENAEMRVCLCCLSGFLRMMPPLSRTRVSNWRECWARTSASRWMLTNKGRSPRPTCAANVLQVRQPRQGSKSRLRTTLLRKRLCNGQRISRCPGCSMLKPVRRLLAQPGPIQRSQAGLQRRRLGRKHMLARLEARRW